MRASVDSGLSRTAKTHPVCKDWTSAATEFLRDFPQGRESAAVQTWLARIAMGWGGGWGFRPYVPVARRRANALRAVQRLAAKGKQVSPVETAGRAIATTFWGKAWCDNLESYSDFENRLPRGRTYVRNGSVVDLQIEPGKITSMVSGSRLYRIVIQIGPLDAVRWKRLKQQCGAGIGSIVELLQGRLSSSVMAVVTSRENGLFPAPTEIEMSCSCPDWAGMCKHLAATLYGVGNRLDHQPDLLFKLRQVDHLELIAEAGRKAPETRARGKKVIAGDQLADVFGIELESDVPAADARQSIPAPRGKSKKIGATKSEESAASKPKKAAASAAAKSSPRQAPAAVAKPAASQRKGLTAAARKRFAEAQRKRRQDAREKMLSMERQKNPSSPKPQKKSAKAKPAPSADGKPARRRRAV